jgi:hypothetical protein
MFVTANAKTICIKIHKNLLTEVLSREIDLRD